MGKGRYYFGFGFEALPGWNLVSRLGVSDVVGGKIPRARYSICFAERGILLMLVGGVFTMMRP